MGINCRLVVIVVIFINVVWFINVVKKEGEFWVIFLLLFVYKEEL